MEGSPLRDVGRPSKIKPYVPQVRQWLREDPDLSSADILRRVRLVGYHGGKSALYEFVRRLRVPGSGYRRCSRCRALLRDIADFCPHCGLSLPSALPPPVFQAEALGSSREETEVKAQDHTSAIPTGARYLVIAAPDRRELYEYFKRKFSRAPSIEVVCERRVAERRKRPAVVGLDRRRRDQRARPPLDVELQTFGFAIVLRD
jgi:hypothetical protein